MALTSVSLMVVYAASCSGAPSRTTTPESESSSTSEPPLAADEPTEVPRVARFTDKLPEIELPKPEPKSEAVLTGDRVADVLDAGCSTTVVRGLSEQIIEEGNCIQPGTYARVSELTNMSFGSAVFPYMLTPARDALEAVVAKGKRYDMKVNSMLRTVAQQYLLYDWYKRGRCGIKLAAVPGNSNHQSGLAIDISTPGTWKKLLRRGGFRWMGKRDRWHFDFVGDKSEAHKGLDVQAFQRLWNRNFPDEPVRADGGWGPDTEEALRRAPADGFPVGAVCRFGDNE